MDHGRDRCKKSEKRNEDSSIGQTDRQVVAQQKTPPDSVCHFRIISPWSVYYRRQIRRVLPAPQAVQDTATRMTSARMPESEPIVQSEIVGIIVEDMRFTTLVTELEATDVFETLQGKEPFPVFAPTDDAFGKMPDRTVEGLLDDLLFHMVLGSVPSEHAGTLDSTDTGQGDVLVIAVTGEGSVTVSEAEESQRTSRPRMGSST